MGPEPSPGQGCDHVVCPDGWDALFSDDDLYCRMCGRRLLDCRLEPSELVFIVDAGSAEPIVVRVDNRNSVRAARLSHQATHPGLSVGADVNGLVDVPAGAALDVIVQLRGDLLEGTHGEIATELRFQAGGNTLLAVPVRVGSAPRFDPSAPKFGALRAGQVGRAASRLRQSDGVATTITRLTFSDDAFTQTGLDVGQRFSTGVDYAFEVRCDSDRLGAGSHTATLTVELSGRWTTVLPLAVEVLRPGRLAIDISGRARKIPQSLTTELTLSLQNDGDTDLSILSLEFPERPDWFAVLAGIELPQRLAAGDTIELSCRVDATALEQKTYKVPVLAAVGDAETVRHQLTIGVVALEVYPDCVGIDFGTTNSCVAYYTDRGVEMVPFRDPEGNLTYIVPSVACYDPDGGRWLVGFEAEAFARVNPERAARSVKRLLNQPKIGNDRERRNIEIGDRSFAPEDVAAEVFRFLKRRTEEHLQRAIDDVVISVPANFTDTGMQAVLAAARRAGLRPFQHDRQANWQDHRIDEPTAASLEAAIGRKKAGGQVPSDAQRYVLIFDFGGGTLDVSILLVTERPDICEFDVVTNKGANWLGGDDFTMALIKLVVDACPHRHKDGSPVRYDVRALRKADVWDNLSETRQREIHSNFLNLWEAAEKAKIELSRAPNDDDLKTDIDVIVSVDNRRHRFKTTVTRRQFEGAVDDLVTHALRVVNRTLHRAARLKPGFSAGALDEVIATGSASLVPLVRRRLAAHLNRDALSPPFEAFSEKACVARGACHYSMIRRGLVREGAAPLRLSGVHDQTNCSYGFDAYEGLLRTFQVIIPEGERLAGYAGNGRTTYRGEPARIDRGGNNTVVTIYQHTGDPEQPEEAVIEGNPDVTAIDRIVISGVKVADKARPPVAEVRMWLADDGMLDAEASVEGHPTQFALENRYRAPSL
jgi:molecular chaperone DnaK (HSP70)